MQNEKQEICYRAYGLNFLSELPLSELPSEPGKPDVIIRYGIVPEELSPPRNEGVLYQATENQFLLKLNGIGRYLVQGGREIIVDRAVGSNDDEVRLFLLGSCLGVLLHQRGILALHASGVRTDQGAILFAGTSGNGKSTLLASFVRRGYQMIADDIAGIVLDPACRPMVLPGYPQIKIWTDAAERLGVSKESLRRLRPRFEKFAMSSVSGIADVPLPLGTIYTLHIHNEADIRIEALEGSARFAAVRQSTFRESFLDILGTRPAHFRLVAAVANTARLSRVFRPRYSFTVEGIADMIEKDWA